MSDDTIRLVTIGWILSRRWRLLAVLALVGALVGYGTSVLFPPRYTTSASVLLPGQWEERELLTQVDIATSSVVVDRAAAALDWTKVSGTELRDRVSAKAADGNIIKISGTADTPEHAQQLSDRMAQQFVKFAARIAGGSTDPDAATGIEALRQNVVETNRRITDLANAADPGQTVESVQARTDLEKLRTSLEEAMTKLDQADPATNKAGMVVMGPAARPTGEAPPTRMQLIVGGALLFFLLAVIGHLVAARVNRRLRTEPQIAAALGSALLGTVDVPDERRAHQPAGGGPRARIRRLLGVDTRWDIPTPPRSGDEAGSRIRYRRVCARLRDQLPAPGGCWSSYRTATTSPAGPPGSSSPRPRTIRSCGWWRSRSTGRQCRTATPSPVPWSCSARAAGPLRSSPASPRRVRTAGMRLSASSSPARSGPVRRDPPTILRTTPLRRSRFTVTRREVRCDDEHDFGVVGSHSAT